MTNAVKNNFGPIFLAPPLPPKRRKVHKLQLAGIEEYINPVKAQPLYPQDHNVRTTPQNQTVKDLEYGVRKALENNWRCDPCFCMPKHS